MHDYLLVAAKQVKLTVHDPDGLQMNLLTRGTEQQGRYQPQSLPDRYGAAHR